MNDKNQPVKYSKLYTAAMKKKTAEVHALARQLDRYNAMAVVRIGQKLTGIKKDLKDEQGHGQWIKWLEESPVFGVRSAQSAMALAEWSVSHAVYFKKWTDLGPSKLGLLMTLPDRVLKELAKHPELKIPGSDTTKTLYDMTQFEMHELIKQYITRPRFDLPTEVKQVKSKMHSAMRAVRGIMPHAQKMGADELMSIEREVTRLLKELREIRKTVAG